MDSSIWNMNDQWHNSWNVMCYELSVQSHEVPELSEDELDNWWVWEWWCLWVIKLTHLKWDIILRSSLRSGELEVGNSLQ